jgi:molybdopterin synthase sulfur carrier subunit
MKVKVRAFASFREILGREVFVELEEKATVKDLLERLCVTHPTLKKSLFDARGDIREEVTLFRRGQSIDRTESLNIALEEEDEVALLPPFSGG